MRRARRGVGIVWRFVFALMSAATAPRRRRTPKAHLYPQHTHARSALSSTCQAAAAAARLFSSPLSHVGVGVDATHMLRAMVRAAARTLPRYRVLLVYSTTNKYAPTRIGKSANGGSSAGAVPGAVTRVCVSVWWSVMLYVWLLLH